MKEIIKHKFPYLLFFLCCFRVLLQFMGKNGRSLLIYQKYPLNTALKEIEKQTSMSVVYNTK